MQAPQVRAGVLTSSQNRPCAAKPGWAGVDDLTQAQGLGLQTQAWLGEGLYQTNIQASASPFSSLAWMPAWCGRSQVPALARTSPRVYMPSHVRNPTGTEPHMHTPPHGQAFRGRPCSLAVSAGYDMSTAGAPLDSAGEVLAAAMGLDELGWAWMSSDGLGWARMGSDGLGWARTSSDRRGRTCAGLHTPFCTLHIQ